MDSSFLICQSPFTCTSLEGAGDKSCVLAFELSRFLRLASHAFGVGSELNSGTNGGLSLSDLTHDMNGFMEFGVDCSNFLSFESLPLRLDL